MMQRGKGKPLKENRNMKEMTLEEVRIERSKLEGCEKELYDFLENYSS